jgi:hypothetical protein
MPGVRHDGISTAQLTIRGEHDDAGALRKRGSEPHGIFAVFEHLGRLAKTVNCYRVRIDSGVVAG